MRFIKTVVLYTTVLLLSICTLSLIAFQVFQADLSNIVLSTLQPYLKAEVKVGSIEVTFFNTFPKGSVELVNVRIKETDSNSVDYAYEIGRAYLLFDYKDLFSGNVRIRHIILRDANINMEYDQNGMSNFRFWKEANDTSNGDSTDLQLDLDRVEVYNTRYSFKNYQDGFELATYIDNGKFSLHTISGDTHMEIAADFDIVDLKDGDIQWLHDKKLRSKLGFSILDLDHYTIKGGNLEIEGMKFLVDGMIDNSKENLFTDIKIQSEHSRLEELLRISPGLLKGSLDDYSISGAAWFNAGIKGEWSASKSARFDIGFGFRNGEIQQQSSGIKLTDLNLDGHYSNGSKQSNQTSFVHLKGLRAKHNTGNIEGDFYLGNFNALYCKAHLKTDVDLAWVHQMFHFDELEDLSGNLTSDLNFDGPLENLDQAENISKVAISGDVQLTDVEFQLEGNSLPIKVATALLSFEKPFLMINNLAATYGASDISIEGYFKNPLTFFVDERLVLNGDLTVDSILWEQFFVSTPNDTVPSEELELPLRIYANLNAEVGYFTYDDFHINDISGNARYYQKQLFLNDISFSGVGGTFGITGIAKQNSYAGYTVDADVSLNQIDAAELFQVFNNFDQDYITSENIKGRISSRPSISFRMNDSFDIEISTLMVDAPITITEGELVDFLPMMKVAGFIKLGHFEHMIFDTLENRIFIQNEIIQIPETRVNSNTVDMLVSGTHTFDNIVDYNMTVNLKKVFMKENKLTDRSFKFYSMKPSGGMVIHLTAKGPADNMDISYDMGALGGNIGKGVAEQGKEIKEAKKKERALKKFRNDSLAQVHRQYQKSQRKGAFREGWTRLQTK